MKKIVKYLMITLPLVAVLVACGDDFLDTPVQNAISKDVLSATQSGADAVLIGAYKMLNGFTNTVGNTWGSAPSNYFYESASDDLHKGSELSDNPDGYDEISIYAWSTGLKAFRDKFQAIYEGVGRANSAILIAQEFKKKGGSDAQVNRITGEALFLRAWYHFDGYKIFKNIPYYFETDIEQKANDQPVLPLVIADLQKAITLLPDNRGSQVGRVDKIVAKAFLGRVLLFNKDFAGAKTNLQEVVSSNRFALVDCFNDNFTIAGDNNKESVFEHQSSVNDGDGNATNTNFLERLAAPHGGSHTGCCGFNNPSQDLVNSYRVDPTTGLPVANPNSNRVKVDKAEVVDPRLDWTVGRTGVPYLDWGVHIDGWIRGSGWAGLHSPKKNMKLVTDAAGPGWTTNQLHAKNYRFLRYADVLLMLAEAEVESNGSLENARALVNQVRKRAANCAQGPVGGPLAVPINDSRITWATYKVGTYDAPFTSQAAARDAVRREIRLEFASEGHRLFDLRRWGILESTVTAYRQYELSVTNIVNGATVKIQDLERAAPVQARHYAFPIPSTEIDLSLGKLKQNDGF
ncbi:MAG: RagB/SusD family nutrient uptake outer membrane protein [Saprospiraceae bacterium]|nr:RagB/SusD family nutrient uptake outer membrane protein [Saprospiraceae bacterium]